MLFNSLLSGTKKSASLIALGIFFSRVFGFVRDRVFAHYLGNSESAGAFRAALRIPNLLQNLFGEGALSSSFIPVYAKLHAEGKEKEANALAASIFGVLFSLMVILSAFGVILSRPLINILAPGFSGETKDLTILLTQILFPSSGILVLSAWCLGVLNSHRKFFLSYAAPVFWNLAIIVCLFIFGAENLKSSELVIKVAWACVVGSGLQFFIQFPKAYLLNKKYLFSLDVKNANTIKVVKNFFPSLISRGVVQFSAYIDQILSSFLGATTVAAMGYAQTLSILPVSLFGISISQAELPEFSSLTGTTEEVKEKLKNKLLLALKRMTFYVLPTIFVFVFLGKDLIRVLFETGKFTGKDSIFVWWILLGYSVGIWASTQARLYVSVFWALQDTQTPLKFALIRVGSNIILGLVSIFYIKDYFSLSLECSAALLGIASGFSGWVELFLIKRKLQKILGAVVLDHLWLLKLVLLIGLAFMPSLLLPLVFHFNFLFLTSLLKLISFAFCFSLLKSLLFKSL